MIVIVDYGVGNLASIQNMFKKIGVASMISDKVADFEGAAKLILPGVGAFDRAMECLADKKLVEPLTHLVMQDKKPVLGVCLGMQLLGISSEEGKCAGLGWIGARTVRFVNETADPSFKIPHMGWNIIKPTGDDVLLSGIESGSRFYFVHSYHMVCDVPQTAIALTPYGGDFASVVRHGNVWGAQFHPEKSHKFGMQLLRNFAEHC